MTRANGNRPGLDRGASLEGEPPHDPHHDQPPAHGGDLELLGARGLSLAHAEYVGDDRARITDALRRAFASQAVVFSFGGIGATPDDHTRQCAAEALGVPLALHPEAVALIDLGLRQTLQGPCRRAPCL